LIAFYFVRLDKQLLSGAFKKYFSGKDGLALLEKFARTPMSIMKDLVIIYYAVQHRQNVT